ncbi:MAG: arylsulfotransferase family protein [Rikenellaceae bacterium]
MKKLIFYFVLLAISCNKISDDISSEIDSSNYLLINGDTCVVDLTKSATYYPVSLSTDAINSVAAQIDSDYSISFNGVSLSNGVSQSFELDNIVANSKLQIVISNNNSGSSFTSYLSVYPSDIDLGTMTINNPEAGYYYYTYNNYVTKLDTEGNLIYYRYADDPHSFNRTEVNGQVYYSFLEKTDSVDSTTMNIADYTQMKAVIMDENYQVIDRVNSIIGNGTISDGIALDNHSFTLIDKGHYLISGYVPTQVYDIPDDVDHADSVNIVEAVVQEIKDGSLIFQWRSSNYTELYALNSSSSFTTSNGSYVDYLHCNCATIDETDGNLLLSLNKLNAVVKVDRASGTGDIIWILGGSGDMFSLSDVQIFYRQHDINFTEDGSITLFNNNYLSGDETIVSEVMKFNLDENNLKVNSFECYSCPTTAIDEGAAQELSATGHYVVSWGRTTSGYDLFGEVDFVNGTTLFSITKTTFLDNSYKVYKYDK